MLMRVEDELLACCSRVSLDAEAKARLSRLVQQPLDWPAVLSDSWWHRIRPLMYLHLSSQPGGLIPDAVLQELTDQAIELAARNLRLSSALEEVAEMFQQRQLRMCVFKGPTLSEDAYGDLGLRECGDLDMLIHPNDFSDVKRMLVDNGFTCVWDGEDSKRQTFGCEFRRPGVELDVHWDLAPRWFNYRIDFETLWSAGTPLGNASVVRKLRPEDTIVVLCIHGTRHWWERLRWICDVAELVNNTPEMDWDRLYSGADRANARRTVQLGLYLTHDLLSTELPPAILQDLNRSPATRRLSRQVATWLAHGERAADHRRLWERFLFRWRLCERARDFPPQLLHYLWAAPRS